MNWPAPTWPILGPFLDLDVSSARRLLDPDGIMDEVEGKRVLCLASGGGQQSAAFALLGAEVTVFDISETQLSVTASPPRTTACQFGRSRATCAI